MAETQATAGKKPPGPNLLLRILALAGAGLFLVAFFLPWWSLSINPKALDDLAKNPKEQFAVNREAFEALNGNAEWYRDHLPRKKLPNATAPPAQQPTQGNWTRTVSDKISAMLFGWNAKTGILAFIFCFVIVALVLVPWIVKILRPWAWIGDAINAALAIPVLVLSMVWWFGSPGADAGGYVRQGIIVGPIVALVGSVAVLVASVLGCIFGVIAFVAWMKK